MASSLSMSLLSSVGMPFVTEPLTPSIPNLFGESEHLHNKFGIYTVANLSSLVQEHVKYPKSFNHFTLCQCYSTETTRGVVFSDNALAFVRLSRAEIFEQRLFEDVCFRAKQRRLMESHTVCTQCAC